MMDPGCPAVSLSPFWQDETVILVQALHAMRLCAEGGHEAMDPGRAVYELQALNPRDRRGLRDFARRIHLSPFPLSSLGDSELIGLVETRIRARDLVALKTVAGGDANGGTISQTVELRRLVRTIDSRLRGHLTESGRRYKVVADVDLATIPGRDGYHVVRRDEALGVLDAIAKQPGTASDLAALLAQAQDKLARDWRPPLSPDGLILLRRIPTVGATAPPESPTLTPSQLRKAMLTWIAVEIVDDDDEPWDGAVGLTFTDGSQRTVAVSSEGVINLEEIEPGTVTVQLPSKTPSRSSTAAAPPVSTKPPVAEAPPPDESPPEPEAQTPEVPDLPVHEFSVCFLDGAGKPLAGVQVLFLNKGTTTPATTDASGKATCTLLGAESVDVTLANADFLNPGAGPN